MGQEQRVSWVGKRKREEETRLFRMFKIGQAQIEFRVEEKSSQAKTYTCDQIHMGIGPNRTLLLEQ